ncbi:MAG: STAS domain-containing protein [Minwuia sp.]|nr:STAS domain-containing protein [Minwuia sp.]
METNEAAVSAADTPSGIQGHAVDLPSFLDLGYAGELKSALQEAMRPGGDLTINGAAVESITSPCIQVLLAAEKTLSGYGRSLNLIEAPPVLTSAFTDLGLNHIQGWSNTQ